MIVYIPLWHVTPADNLPSIQERGVDPSFSEGARKLSWYVSETELVWAFAHVAARRKLQLADLAACLVSVPEQAMKRTSWADVWTAKDIFQPVSYFGVERALRDYEYAMKTAEKSRKALVKLYGDLPF